MQPASLTVFCVGKMSLNALVQYGIYTVNSCSLCQYRTMLTFSLRIVWQISLFHDYCMKLEWYVAVGTCGEGRSREWERVERHLLPAVKRCPLLRILQLYVFSNHAWWLFSLHSSFILSQNVFKNHFNRSNKDSCLFGSDKGLSFMVNRFFRISVPQNLKYFQNKI